jgi:hypothetical protein
MRANCCGDCRHFVAAAGDLEQEVVGLKILSSAYGSVRAETGLCRQRDFFCVPSHACSDWQGPHSVSSLGRTP